MIDIIIPIYNEENRLASSLAQIYQFIKNKKDLYELIIVNDGSNDGSRKILEDLKSKYHLTILHHDVNKGKGAAIRTGIEKAQADIILFTDIDLSVPIEFVDTYIKNLDEDIDVIIGTREASGSRVEIRQFWLRELLGLTFTLFSNIILWMWISDFTCGFKMFRKQAAKRIFKRQKINRWAFDAEVLFLAKKYGFKIKEMPIIWRHREGSKVRFPWDLIETLISLLVIRINDFRGVYD